MSPARHASWTNPSIFMKNNPIALALICFATMPLASIARADAAPNTPPQGFTALFNGTVILDADLSKVTEFMANSPHPGKDRKSGHFGFAGHDDPVMFRNISIKSLK